MDKKWIIDNVFPKIELDSRKLEVLKIRELLFDENNSLEILKYLDNLQNEDGGFPGFLEPDVRSSNSTIIATQIALDNYLHCGGIKNKLVKEKVENYLNSKYNQEEDRWNIVSGDITNAGTETQEQLPGEETVVITVTDKGIDAIDLFKICFDNWGTPFKQDKTSGSISKLIDSDSEAGITVSNNGETKTILITLNTGYIP